MTTQALLAEIQHLSRGKIGDDVLDEVRAHLEASIQARLEVGVSPDAAEEEAIAQFGSPAEFVRKMSERQLSHSWFDPHVFWALFASMSAFTVFVDWNAGLPQMRKVIWLLMTGFYVAMLIASIWWLAKTSSQVRRAQLAPLFVVFLLGILVNAACMSVIYVADRGWMPSIGRPRAEFARDLPRAREQLGSATRLKQDWQLALNAHLNGREQHLTRPIWHYGDVLHPSGFVLMPASSKAEADRAWRLAIRNAGAEIDSDTRSALWRIDEDNEALHRSAFLNFVYYLPCGAWTSFALMQLLALFHLVPWLVSAIGRRRRLSRQNGAVA